MRSSELRGGKTPRAPGSITTIFKCKVEGHRKLLDIQEVYAKARDELDEANVAKLARRMIKEHLMLLAEMSKVG